MINILLWTVFIYPLVGLCIFWPMTCFVDREIPNIKYTIQITFLWPVVLFLIVLFYYDELERRKMY